MKSILVLEKPKAGETELATLLAQQYEQAQLIQKTSRKEARQIISRLAPELAVLDIELLDGQAPEFISSLLTMSPRTTCIVVAFENQHEKIFRALKAGAKGYLYKNNIEDQLLKHLDKILNNQPDVSPAVAYQMIGYFHKQPELPDDMVLSARETEILSLIASGKKRAEVAEKLHISLNTVATHIKAIYRKLDISSQSEATLEAIRRGLIKK